MRTNKLKKLKKLIYALSVPIIFCVLMATGLDAEAAGWGKDSKGYYYYYDDDGHYYKNESVKIGQYSYYFDENGYMITGWHCVDTGIWYYANRQGVLITGWVQANGRYFYVEEGRMQKSKWVDGERYYVCSTGEMTTNYVAPYLSNGKTEYYYLGKDGKVDTRTGWKLANQSQDNSGYSLWTYTDNRGKVPDGWLKYGGKWYHFSSGIMDRGVREIDEKTYVFAYTGEMLTNSWFNSSGAYSKSGEWYYATATGEAKIGWLKLGQSWYYFASTGQMCTGKISVENSDGSKTDYYAKSSGELVYGWYHDKSYDGRGNIVYDDWYYTNPRTGECYTGWVKRDGEWRYISKGSMVSNGTVVCLVWDNSNGKYVGQPEWDDYDSYSSYREAYESFMDANTYVFDLDGKLVHGWYVNKTSTYSRSYYGDSNGRAYNGWIKSGDKYYYFSDGVMLINKYTPDGYYVDYNGVCQ